jgi:hypothetical protein
LLAAQYFPEPRSLLATRSFPERLPCSAAARPVGSPEGTSSSGQPKMAAPSDLLVLRLLYRDPL